MMLRFTYQTKSNSLIEVQGKIKENDLIIDVSDTEDYYGSYHLTRDPV